MSEQTSSGPPDPRKSLFIFASGKKGTGKSYVCRSWWDAYPFDRMCIDITHDLRADFREEQIPFTDIDIEMLPGKLPAPVSEENRGPQTYVACPDMGSKTWLDDIDRVIGLCLRPKGNPMLLWVDEFGAITKGSKTGPNMRRVLHHGRHSDLSLLLACPRPMDVDPLGIAQADLVYTFRTNQVYDRERIADTIGWDRGEFTQVNGQLRGHEHTLFDARNDTLSVMPPLPPRRRGYNQLPPLPE